MFGCNSNYRLLGNRFARHPPILALTMKYRMADPIYPKDFIVPAVAERRLCHGNKVGKFLLSKFTLKLLLVLGTNLCGNNSVRIYSFMFLRFRWMYYDGISQNFSAFKNDLSQIRFVKIIECVTKLFHLKIVPLFGKPNKCLAQLRSFTIK